MAAPTPVSALVHSRTLVTAGLYLLFRFNFLLIRRVPLKILFRAGIITTIIGSFIACYRIDFKKIVAFSTLSQLGIIIIRFFSHWKGLLMFQLLSHAFLKRCIFLLAGFIIIRASTQSIKKICQLAQKNYLISLIYLVLLNFANFLITIIYFSKEHLLISTLFDTKTRGFLFLLLTSLTFLYVQRIFNFLTSGQSKTFLQQKENFKFKKRTVNYLIILIFFRTLFKTNLLNMFFLKKETKTLLMRAYLIFFLKKNKKVFLNYLRMLFMSLNLLISLSWSLLASIKREEAMLGFKQGAIYTYKNITSKITLLLVSLIFIG
jgi:NADH:ubiquinone oxidoreductase subunit 5 (subunit L)/multisubunit Na+/H+ antiporter MnhA subunit